MTKIENIHSMINVTESEDNALNAHRMTDYSDLDDVLMRS